MINRALLILNAVVGNIAYQINVSVRAIGFGMMPCHTVVNQH